MLRIISGKFRNRKIVAPKGMETRPTSERLREAVFNMLQHQIESAEFLDLFAGSGAMGLEALSRGAKRVVLVENDRAAIEAIQKNMKELETGPEALIVRTDIFRAMDRIEEKGERYDVIYVDPPYTTRVDKGEKSVSVRVLQRLDAGKFLKERGVLFIEESKEAAIAEVPLKQLKLMECRSYGRSQLFLFEVMK